MSCQACGAALAENKPAPSTPAPRDERLPAGPLALLASVVLAAALFLVVVLTPGFVVQGQSGPQASPTSPQATATDGTIDGDQSGGGLPGTFSPSLPTATATPRGSRGGRGGTSPTATPSPTAVPTATATPTPTATPTFAPTATPSPTPHSGG